MMKSEDKQISLTDPDARSMPTSGKDTGIVGYNVQTAVDTKNHLIVAHEVTNVGTDRRQLSNIAEQARTEMGVETLDAVADRGYYAGEEIRACEEAGITVTLPKPMTSNAKAAGRFGKQDFRYVAAEDAYVCPAGQRLAYSFTTEDKGLLLRRYRTNACQSCAIRHSCTTGKERLISRWEHEAVLETVQARLDQHPEKMTIRRQTAEHPFGTIKCWMGATHFLTKRLPKVATEMALNVLAYNILWRSSAWPGCWRPWPPKPRGAARPNKCQQTPWGSVWVVREPILLRSVLHDREIEVALTMARIEPLSTQPGPLATMREGRTHPGMC